MKLLVKSDDYGFTTGVTDGIVDAMKNGIITCTGLFANMPSAAYAVERIKECPHVCFGIDINIVSGPCVADPKQIPTLVDDHSEFIRSTVKYNDSRFVKQGENELLWPYAECLIEARAQIERYIELVGKKPEYVTTHSISNHAAQYLQAVRDAAREFNIPFSKDLFAEFQFKSLPSLNVKPFTMEAQLNADVEKYTLEQLEAYKEEEYVNMGGHGGFVDDELLKYSTYTLIRVKDHAMYTSFKIKKWIEENNVELISFRELIESKGV